MKKFLSFFLAITMAFCLFSCSKKNDASSSTSTSNSSSSSSSSSSTASSSSTEKSSPATTTTSGSRKSIKVALLCIGDENDQGYSYNFIQGRDEATERLKKDGIDVEWVTKYNIGEDATCENANIEAVGEDCKIVFNNSYGFEPYMLKVAPQYPEVQFVGCTNQNSNVSPLANVHNAFAKIYEGRYLAGVVAGMKLQEMIKSNKIKPDQALIGYVGAYPFAEVISGYSAYYLGAKSVCPTVKMLVSFVNSWSDATAEADAAASLADRGCVMISQHSDNTTPATTAQKKGVFHTGYNADMTGVAPSASLISCRIDWSEYFYETIKTYLEKGSFDKDWCKGIEANAVKLTKLNKAIAAQGTEEKIKEVQDAIISGKLQVFDTSTFTINGKQITDKDNDKVYDKFAAVKKPMIYDGAFHESTAQSAPYFIGEIDGITKLN